MKMNEIFLDELNCIAAQLKKCVGDFSVFTYDEIVIVSDGGAISRYLYYFFMEKTSLKVCCVGCEELDSYLSESHTKSRLIFFLAEGDLSQKRESLARWLREGEKGGGDFIFAPVFSYSAPHPEGIVSIAEKEMRSLAEREPEGSELRLMTELEALCAESAIRGLNVRTVRFNNVFGPFIEDSLGIHRIAADIAEKNATELKKSDMALTYTGCYIREAIVALCLVAAKGKEDNIYNAGSCEFTLYDIKSILLKRRLDSNPQVTFVDDSAEKGCMKTDIHKLKSLGFEVTSDLDDALYRTLCSVTGEEYEGRYLTDIYHGKLGKIQALEMDILEVIDRICRENGIKYFPVGGTLLGAVRHGGFIPWDDDIDIGMLREDFEKFRRICPGLLPEGMSYHSHLTDKKAQYAFDKIRLSGTDFSMEFSGQFEDMENGIFIDILVYDKTANTPLMQKNHIKLIKLFTFLLNVRWVGKDSHRGPKKLLVKLIKLFPFGFYHKLLDGALKMYSRKKNSRYLIDGVGQYLTAGAFPLGWYDELIDMKFGKLTLKAPKGYDGYLRHWYGDGYADLLPLSSRASGHRLSRLDLGEYLFEEKDREEN